MRPTRLESLRSSAFTLEKLVCPQPFFLFLRLSQVLWLLFLERKTRGKSFNVKQPNATNENLTASLNSCLARRAYTEPLLPSSPSPIRSARIHKTNKWIVFMRKNSHSRDRVGEGRGRKGTVRVPTLPSVRRSSPRPVFLLTGCERVFLRLCSHIARCLCGLFCELGVGDEVSLGREKKRALLEDGRRRNVSLCLMLTVWKDKKKIVRPLRNPSEGCLERVYEGKERATEKSWEREMQRRL